MTPALLLSVFDLFKIGIGPSSSHTVGPMKAAKLFAERLKTFDCLSSTQRVTIDLYGSLGATGKGHGSDRAVMLGLMGETPEEVDIEKIESYLKVINETSALLLLGAHPVTFLPSKDIRFYRRSLPQHPNGMRFSAFGNHVAPLLEATFFSVGGGFIEEQGIHRTEEPIDAPSWSDSQFQSAAELLNHAMSHQKAISAIMRIQERRWRSDNEIDEGLLRLWRVMQDCVERGCQTQGTLPGPLKVRRRANKILHQLNQSKENSTDPLAVMDWVNLFALAVNEENAAGGRIVTAPTNGAAGIIPAVLHYYTRFVPNASEAGVIRFLLTAGAIGTLYKRNASISGAEVGCQGEVGVACSMAAAGLCEVLGGSPQQVENAAEIAMEHHLGLTCDPVGGLVQIPCIERNAIGSVKAINAARMALMGDGAHVVSLDKVIKTMRDTGADMAVKYKETSRGGLAVNIVEC